MNLLVVTNYLHKPRVLAARGLAGTMRHTPTPRLHDRSRRTHWSDPGARLVHSLWYYLATRKGSLVRRYRRGRSADSWCVPLPRADQVGFMHQCEETSTQERIRSKDQGTLWLLTKHFLALPSCLVKQKLLHSVSGMHWRLVHVRGMEHCVQRERSSDSKMWQRISRLEMISRPSCKTAQFWSSERDAWARKFQPLFKKSAKILVYWPIYLELVVTYKISAYWLIYRRDRNFGLFSARDISLISSLMTDISADLQWNFAVIHPGSWFFRLVL
jgi:hypothetical protein